MARFILSATLAVALASPVTAQIIPIPGPEAEWSLAAVGDVIMLTDWRYVHRK